MFDSLTVTCNTDQAIMFGFYWKIDQNNVLRIFAQCAPYNSGGTTICNSCQTPSFTTLDEDGNYNTLKGLANMPVIGFKNDNTYYLEKFKIYPTANTNEYYFTYSMCKTDRSCTSNCYNCAFFVLNKCTRCLDGYHRGTNLDKTYDMQPFTCDSCYIGCATCNNAGDFYSPNCTLCKNSYYFLEDDSSKCFYTTSFPNKYYFDSISQI